MNCWLLHSHIAPSLSRMVSSWQPVSMYIGTAPTMRGSEPSLTESWRNSLLRWERWKWTRQSLAAWEPSFSLTQVGTYWNPGWYFCALLVEWHTCKCRQLWLASPTKLGLVELKQDSWGQMLERSTATSSKIKSKDISVGSFCSLKDGLLWRMLPVVWMGWESDRRFFLVFFLDGV